MQCKTCCRNGRELRETVPLWQRVTFGRWARWSVGRWNAAVLWSGGGDASTHLWKVCEKYGKVPHLWKVGESVKGAV